MPIASLVRAELALLATPRAVPSQRRSKVDSRKKLIIFMICGLHRQADDRAIISYAPNGISYDGNKKRELENSRFLISSHLRLVRRKGLFDCQQHAQGRFPPHLHGGFKVQHHPVIVGVALADPSRTDPLEHLGDDFGFE